jgi:hypothetical protein
MTAQTLSEQDHEVWLQHNGAAPFAYGVVVRDADGQRLFHHSIPRRQVIRWLNDALSLDESVLVYLDQIGVSRVHYNFQGERERGYTLTTDGVRERGIYRTMGRPPRPQFFVPLAAWEPVQRYAAFIPPLPAVVVEDHRARA